VKLDGNLLMRSGKVFNASRVRYNGTILFADDLRIGTGPTGYSASNLSVTSAAFSPNQNYAVGNTAYTTTLKGSTVYVNGLTTGYVKSGVSGALSNQVGVPHTDLTYSGLVAGQVLRATGAAAASFGSILAGDLPSSIDPLKISPGTVDSTEFGYIDGVTSSVQTQFSGKQPLDATLTSLAAYNSNGMLTQTAADTFAARTITGTSNRLSVSNGNGVAGNPTLDIDTNYAGQATITTLGTVTTGTWNAGAITSSGAITSTLAAGNSLVIDTNTLVVDATNNRVGIGTAAPSRTLHINNVDGGIRLQNPTAVTGKSWDVVSNTDGTFTVDEPGVANRIQIIADGTLSGGKVNLQPTGGNVGIGTAAPTEALTLGDSKNIQVGVSDGAGGALMIRRKTPLQTFPASSGGLQYVQGAVADRLALLAGSAEIVSILETGNVGIGTPTPDVTLSVVGNVASNIPVKIRNTNTGGYSGLDIFNEGGSLAGSLWIAGSTTGSTNNLNAVTLASRVSGQKVFIVAGGYDPVASGGITVSAGNVGIGTTNPSAMLSVGATSQFQVSSAGAITGASLDAGSGIIQTTGTVKANSYTRTTNGDITITAPSGNVIIKIG
jgi:hypothetical protein